MNSELRGIWPWEAVSVMWVHAGGSLVNQPGCLDAFKQLPDHTTGQCYYQIMQYKHTHFLFV